ncbi:hypothetical protein BDV10DRAFT_31764 [Aspergillus recurvatus]
MLLPRPFSTIRCISVVGNKTRVLYKMLIERNTKILATVWTSTFAMETFLCVTLHSLKVCLRYKRMIFCTASITGGTSS